MEKNKNQKTFYLKARAIILLIAVLVLGVFILWKIARSLLQLLSNRRLFIEPDLHRVDLLNGENQEAFNFHELLNGIIDNNKITDKDVDASRATNADATISNPVEAYLAIRRELSKIRTMNELTALIQKHGSAQNIASIGKLEAITTFMGEEEIMATIMNSVSEEIKSAKKISSINNKAIIKIISKSGQEGEATMVFERGNWKLDSKQW